MATADQLSQLESQQGAWLRRRTFRVFVCETQPVVIEGLRSFLSTDPSFEFAGTVGNLADIESFFRRHWPVHVAIVDKSFGLKNVVQVVERLRGSFPDCSFVVWGTSLSEAEALRLIRAGVRGVLRKSASLTALGRCLHAVCSGVTWMENALFRSAPVNGSNESFTLTPRERQILELVEKGLKNREIADELGIRPGTVKIHLKHIFEKTGIRGRYGLVLSNLRGKGMVRLT